MVGINTKGVIHTQTIFGGGNESFDYLETAIEQYRRN